jgi:hypothetical protein
LSPQVEKALNLVESGLSVKQQTELQEHLHRAGVTPGWLAKRMKENALAMKPISYCGVVTGWVPDFQARNKAVEALHRVRGDIEQAGAIAGGVAVELTLTERRQLQVRIAAKLTTWGRAYAEADSAQG